MPYNVNFNFTRKKFWLFDGRVKMLENLQIFLLLCWRYKANRWEAFLHLNKVSLRGIYAMSLLNFMGENSRGDLNLSGGWGAEHFSWLQKLNWIETKCHKCFLIIWLKLASLKFLKYFKRSLKKMKYLQKLKMLYNLSKIFKGLCRCSQKFRKIYRKTPVPEPLFQ